MHLTAQKYANLLAISYSINYLKNTKQRISLYTMIMNYEILRMLLDQPKNISKYFCKLYSDHDLEFTILWNRKVVKFLDITLILENLTYRPYLKDNNRIIYVNTEYNHPRSIMKQLSKSIELRLSQLLYSRTHSCHTIRH